MLRKRFSRRKLLATVLPAAAATPLVRPFGAAAADSMQMCSADHGAGMAMAMPAATMAVGEAVPAPGGPHDLDHLLYPPEPRAHRPGRVREYSVMAMNREIEIAHGVKFDAWTYNGTVPGPVIRASEDDVLRVRFENAATHPHTMHFHGIHPADMDGVNMETPPGGVFYYEFRARPAGMHLYHCHSLPLAEHISRGLYGAFIVDPPAERPKARELVMILSAFDTDGDYANDVYAMNGRAFYYTRYPIKVRRSETVRIYLANVTEYDLINSFHVHGEMFRLYRTGTTAEYEYTDIVTLGQGERCIVEIDFHNPGLFMFHAHQSRFADRGAMGWFDVADDGPSEAAVRGASGRVGRGEGSQLGDKAITKY